MLFSQSFVVAVLASSQGMAAIIPPNQPNHGQIRFRHEEEAFVDKNEPAAVVPDKQKYARGEEVVVPDKQKYARGMNHEDAVVPDKQKYARGEDAVVPDKQKYARAENAVVPYKQKYAKRHGEESVSDEVVPYKSRYQIIEAVVPDKQKYA